MLNVSRLFLALVCFVVEVHQPDRMWHLRTKMKHEEKLKPYIP